MLKNCVIMKQQNLSPESACQLTSIATKNDISHGDRQCNAVLTLERHYKYMLAFANQSDIWRDFFSAMLESWKKLKTSNVVLSFIIFSNRNRSALVRDLLSYNSVCQSVVRR